MPISPGGPGVVQRLGYRLGPGLLDRDGFGRLLRTQLVVGPLDHEPRIGRPRVGDGAPQPTLDLVHFDGVGVQSARAKESLALDERREQRCCFGEVVLIHQAQSFFDPVDVDGMAPSYRADFISLNRCPQSVHFILTRATGPANVKGWVCRDPHAGQAGRGGGSPSSEAGRVGSPLGTTDQRPLRVPALPDRRAELFRPRFLVRFPLALVLRSALLGAEPSLESFLDSPA